MIWEVFGRSGRASRSCTAARSTRRTGPSPMPTRASSTRGGRSRSRSGSCPREAIHAIEEFPDEFDLKYRRVDGYSIKARLKEARERAGTSAAASAG